MSVVPAVQECLRCASVPSSVFPRTHANTAREEAAVTHVPGRYWAKTVICFVDGQPIHAVVPVDLVLDLDALAVVALARSILLAGENELWWRYPDCECGAMPALARLCRQTIDGREAPTGKISTPLDPGAGADRQLRRPSDLTTRTRRGGKSRDLVRKTRQDGGDAADAEAGLVG